MSVVSSNNNKINIKYIGPFHIIDCSKLTKLFISNDIGIKSIPKECFASTFLKEITIPDTIAIIGSNAFYSCNELEKVIISNVSQIEVIKMGAFNGCHKLKSINHPSKIKIITKNCFSFTGLNSIDIPQSVKRINKMAFFNCKFLEKVTFNENLRVIGVSSFANNYALKTINLPDSLTIIKSSAFLNCINLLKVNTTPNTQLTEIHNFAFDNTQIEELLINRAAVKLFDPTNVPKLKRIHFYNGYPLNFIQTEDGAIYEKCNKKDETMHELNDKFIDFMKWYRKLCNIQSLFNDNDFQTFVKQKGKLAVNDFTLFQQFAFSNYI